MTATHGVGTYGNGVGTVTTLDHKMANLGLFLKTAANTIRPGLLWDGTSTVISGTATMSYSVRAFAAVLSRGATSGAVYLTNDGVLSVATTAAPGSNSRIDVVYVWQREFSIDGTDSNPVIGVVQGTAAASPTVPSLAAFPGAIALAQIIVPAGVTATNSGTTITQVNPFTSVDGGNVVTRTSADFAGYTPVAVDARVWNIADQTTYRWDGANWKPWEASKVSFTPTLTNVTLGTGGTNTATYTIAAGQYFVNGRILLGTGGAFTGSVQISPPVNQLVQVTPNETLLALGKAVDTGVQAYPIILEIVSATAIAVQVLGAAGTYVAPTPVNATVPFTAGAGDEINYKYTFLPA